MKCEIKGCDNEVTALTGPAGRALCPKHKYMSPDKLAKELKPNKASEPAQNKGKK